MNTERQKQVMNIVWPWKKAAVVVKQDVATRPEPQKVLLDLLVPIAVGVMFLIFSERRLIPLVAFSMATLIMVSGFFVPSLYYAIKRMVHKIIAGVGIGATWILLVPFFYVFFTIGHMSQIVFGRDPMNRACPSDAETYWIKHAAKDDLSSYSRQY
ncbi:MAG: hypothetical protein KAI74_04385 [Kiritimatiellae bacterium]|nr:hypothetical protein [Kiritimatiellia bacterium]